MKKYINDIEHLIEIQIKKTNATTIIRLEGMNNPKIYKQVCSYFDNNRNINLNAKLSKRKYDYFIENSHNNMDWNNDLEYLNQKGFIDIDDTMTRWRNNSTEIQGNNNLLLMMGTEVVDDKGGLEDFYCITPETILANVKKDYSKWFEDMVEVGKQNKENQKAINTFLKKLFTNVNIDLISLSNLIEELEELELNDVNEIITEICFRLDKYWGIPNVLDEKKIPKFAALKTGSVKKADILEKSFQFINRSKFNNNLTNAKLQGFSRKIDKYKEENDIDENMKFPEDSMIFNSYNDFKNDLLEFIKGKNYVELKSKFLKIDYALIDKILGIKLDSNTPGEKIEKLYGEPIEVYIEMLSKSVLAFKSEKGTMPEKIVLKVNNIKISNCSTEEEKEKSLLTLSMNLEGILEYLNLKEKIGVYPEFIYESENDAFKSDFESITTTKSSGVGDLSKIKYTLVAYGENEKICIKNEFEYLFKSNDDWMLDFYLLEEKYKNIQDKSTKIPFYIKGEKLEEYVSCESDDEFFAKIEKLNPDTSNDNYDSDIFNIGNEKINNCYGLLKNDYKNFLNKLREQGFYNTLTASNECKKVFERYSELLECAYNEYGNMIASQKKEMELLYNMFIIGDKSYIDFKKSKNEVIILAPHHPVMLEKIYYRNEYLRESLYEILDSINITNKVTKNSIEKKLGYAFKMCFINSGFDIYAFKGFKELVLGKTFGKFSLYCSKDKESNTIYSENLSLKSESLGNGDIKKIIKKSHKSDIISQNMLDYVKTFPSRVDGLDILFINPDDMQHIVSGINSAVDIISGEYGKINLKINIIISAERKRGSNYLKLWLNNYLEQKENVSVKIFVKYFDFSADKLKDTFNKKIKSQDLAYMYSILENENIDFLKTSLSSIEEEMKYPLIYNPMPVCIYQEERTIDISQKQFKTTTSHTQLIHKLAKENAKDGYYRIVKKMIVSDEKKDLIAEIHKKSNWVVCLDETIDKNILNMGDSKIIGFSTGKGIFGELNTTVSATEFVIEDIQIKLKNRLMQKFDKWMPEIAEKVAGNCINISKGLDGSKMLKALNPNDYEIHNYLAYILTMKALKIDVVEGEKLIKVLINLDNYLHWFDQDMSKEYMKETKSRPDFLVLEVYKDENLEDVEQELKIKATVIECKMGNQSESQIESAKDQVFEGIKTLGNNFSGEIKNTRTKYWCNQLYRAIVFSKLNIKENDEKYQLIIDKLTKVVDGKFTIEWHGRVFTYWTNSQDKDIKETNIIEEFNERRSDDLLDVKSVNINEFGQTTIQKMLLGEEFKDINVEYIEQKEDEEEYSIDLIKESVIESIDEESEKKPIKINLEKEEKEEKEDVRVDETKDIDDKERVENHVESTKLDEQEKEEEKEEDFKIINKLSIEEEPITKDIRILLGEDIRTKEKIYWEYTNKELNNRHLLINGNSGSGKTYCIQTLILEAVKNNISVIVFDYTDGFTESKLSPVLLNKLGKKFESRFVKYEKFPINPFKKGSIILPGGKEVPELDEDIANRIADSFANVYKFKEQQRSAIYTSVRACLKKYGNSTTLEAFRNELKECENKSASTVLSKVEALVDYDPFLGDTDFSWKDIIEQRGQMYVIQLSGYTREIQVILTELILWDIWNYAVKHGNETTPIPLVLDEAQNLPHGENSPSGKILTEGRKFGVSGWYATQFMAGKLNAAEIGNLQQSAQKLYFSPPETCTLEVAKYIDITNDRSKMWAEKLSKLVKGKSVSCGFKLNANGKFTKYEPRIIQITSLEDRINE